jgi:hypothetical protein
MAITAAQILARFEENHLPCRTLALQNGVTIIVTEWGGRVLGPFLPGSEEALFWTHPAFADPQAFRMLIETDWNLGGDRMWIGPELQYLVRDRTDYFGSSFIPRAMDPGAWRMTAEGDRCRLDIDMTLEAFNLASEAFNLASGCKQLHLDVHLRPAADPLRHLPDAAALLDGVVYAGYEQTAALSETAADAIPSCIWNVVELLPGGELVIPTRFGYPPTVYTGMIAGDRVQPRPGQARVSLDGRQMIKIGYKALDVTGRMGYLYPMPGEKTCLVVRTFPDHPACDYPEEPPDHPAPHGDSLFVYNDDGTYGGYGEMECFGHTIGGPAGISQATDTFGLFLYQGETTRVLEIARRFLGVQA